MIKSAKNAKREMRIGVVRIAYLLLVGDLSYLSIMVCRISLLSREEIFIFRDKSPFPCQRLILPYQELSFPYLGLSLQGVRDSEVGKLADYITSVDFPLLGAYL